MPLCLSMHSVQQHIPTPRVTYCSSVDRVLGVRRFLGNMHRLSSASSLWSMALKIFIDAFGKRVPFCICWCFWLLWGYMQGSLRSNDTLICQRLLGILPYHQWGLLLEAFLVPCGYGPLITLQFIWHWYNHWRGCHQGHSKGIGGKELGSSCPEAHWSDRSQYG